MRWAFWAVVLIGLTAVAAATWVWPVSRILGGTQIQRFFEGGPLVLEWPAATSHNATMTWRADAELQYVPANYRVRMSLPFREEVTLHPGGPGPYRKSMFYFNDNLALRSSDTNLDGVRVSSSTGDEVTSTNWNETGLRQGRNEFKVVVEVTQPDGDARSTSHLVFGPPFFVIDELDSDHDGVNDPHDGLPIINNRVAGSILYFLGAATLALAVVVQRTRSR